MMRMQSTRSSRRVGVAVNYLSLVLATAIAGWGDEHGWNWKLGGPFIAMMVILAVTFIQTQVRTGLFTFIHRKVERLDERERELSYEALRHGYGIFAILALILLLLLMIASDSSFSRWFTWIHSMGRPVFLAMFYAAHTLPAAVLAWNHDRVEEEA